MTQQEIEVFLAVVKTGSVSGAAQALYITQPAVSRHIRTLERELGCPLLIRERGVRRVELTDQGRDFIQVAEKWRQVWQEAREAAGRDRERTLTFHNYHSQEAYDYVAQGLVDLALISDDMYHPQVETVPAFREPMVLVTGPGSPLPAKVHPSQLDPARELRLPWNPEYDLWHDFWFPPIQSPRVLLDQMPLLEYFLRQRDLWAILPVSAAERMTAIPGVRIRRLREGPPERYIYYLVKKPELPPLAEQFLGLLDEKLRKIEGITSLL